MIEVKKNKNPSFCYIAPIRYLEFTLASKTHLILAHLVDKSSDYADFYRQRADAGDLVIMDNGAYELKKPYETTRLLELGEKCNADVIVLPDYPFSSSTKTINAAEQYLEQFLSAGFRTMFVPQSEIDDLEDWIRGYEFAVTHPSIAMIGMSILGIPNALSKINPAYARVVMTQLLIDREVFDFEKHHHYLGLNAGPALEIPSLIRMNALDTIDSSGPIWSAILGHAYTEETDSYQIPSKIKLPVDFYCSKTTDSDTHKRIMNNISLTQIMINNARKQKSVWYANENTE